VTFFLLLLGLFGLLWIPWLLVRWTARMAAWAPRPRGGAPRGGALKAIYSP
jgi:hypothetical protein